MQILTFLCLFCNVYSAKLSWFGSKPILVHRFLIDIIYWWKICKLKDQYINNAKTSRISYYVELNTNRNFTIPKCIHDLNNNVKPKFILHNINTSFCSCWYPQTTRHEDYYVFSYCNRLTLQNHKHSWCLIWSIIKCAIFYMQMYKLPLYILSKGNLYITCNKDFLSFTFTKSLVE